MAQSLLVWFGVVPLIVAPLVMIVMVAKSRSAFDSLGPIFQIGCFLVLGFALFTFGWPVLENVLGEEFLEFLSNVNGLDF